MSVNEYTRLRRRMMLKQLAVLGAYHGALFNILARVEFAYASRPGNYVVHPISAKVEKPVASCINIEKDYIEPLTGKIHAVGLSTSVAHYRDNLLRRKKEWQEQIRKASNEEKLQYIRRTLAATGLVLTAIAMSTTSVYIIGAASAFEILSPSIRLLVHSIYSDDDINKLILAYGKDRAAYVLGLVIEQGKDQAENLRRRQALLAISRVFDIVKLSSDIKEILDSTGDIQLALSKADLARNTIREIDAVLDALSNDDKKWQEFYTSIHESTLRSLQKYIADTRHAGCMLLRVQKP